MDFQGFKQLRVDALTVDKLQLEFLDRPAV
jgi:hypothetical protein